MIFSSKRLLTVAALELALLPRLAFAAMPAISGVVLDEKNELVPGAKVEVQSGSTMLETETDGQGQFSIAAPACPCKLTVSGKFIATEEQALDPADDRENLQLHVRYVISPVQDSMVITATALDPGIDRRNTEVYKKTLFERDDQLLETLSAGINAGQHEGGGKSLEIRRYGFNLDHGGVNGGLKIVVNDLPQNQASQGHGQGYLGSLKALTPELVDEVNILNGPFSAEYGDFSGLGVVQIRTRETLPDEFTARLQGGSFDTFRTFLAYSPQLEKADSFISYEGSYTDGPFLNPLRYKRNNFTGNYTRHLDGSKAVGLKLNFGTNDFYSSGQLPLDLVNAGDLNRFGYIDPTDGGKAWLGTAAAYYKKDFTSGDSFKSDIFVGRSLFDLYSNFTFFLNDPVHGDAVLQHDSRLQEGANMQFLHLYKIFGAQALLTVGSNFHDNQINVGLLPRVGRTVTGVTTDSHLVIPNFAGYAQQAVDFLNGRLHVEAGLRWDYFRWHDEDLVNPSVSGALSANKFQPKAAVAYTPSNRVPVTLSLNYGRGISTQDARGIVERPHSPRIATTDFYQAGAAYHLRSLSFSTDVFLIDRSNEQVYIPDDGTFEFKGPSRSYGYEGKMSLHFTRHLSLNGGVTQVVNSFYRGTFPRQYVDSAPHNVANAGVTLSDWHGFYSSVRYRHSSHYRLDPINPLVPLASGLDVMDLEVTKQIRPWIELNMGIDNLTNKRYYETQNHFESQPTLDPASRGFRVHATPGYPFDASAGITFRLGHKAR
jgi:outer membrane receptor protein involved in Fe transport